MTVDHLPKFRRPPVVETVLGVQFEPLPDIGSAHLGAFWKELGDDWPEVVDAPTLESQSETFSPENMWEFPKFGLKLSQTTEVRLRINSRDEKQMIQVQNGRFHYNWLGYKADGTNYPNYENVRPNFDEKLEHFRRFLLEQSDVAFQPNQWEVTYVNHILKGTVWDGPDDWRKLFCGLPTMRGEHSGIGLEKMSGDWQYEIKPQRGRLHVNISHGYRKQPIEGELLVMKLTARGKVSSDEGFDLGSGLDIGHGAIVKMFAALTSDDAHKNWEMIDGNH